MALPVPQLLTDIQGACAIIGVRGREGWGPPESAQGNLWGAQFLYQTFPPLVVLGEFPIGKWHRARLASGSCMACVAP